MSAFSPPLPQAHPVVACLPAAKQLIEHLRRNPRLIHAPQLAFFATYVRSLGATLPTVRKATEPHPAVSSAAAPAAMATGSTHDGALSDSGGSCISDLEEDDGIVKADTSPFPEQGRHLAGAASPTDQERGAAGALKIQAMEASAAGDYARALDLLTRVVKAVPTALNYAYRAQVLLQVTPARPVACIRDCDVALRLNSDSAKALKVRGRAHRMLGHWEAASNDLRRACRIDFDPDTEELRVLCDHRTAKIQARQAKRRRAQLGQERRQARRTSTGNVVEPQSPHTTASLPAIDASVAAAMGIPPELVGMLLADPDVAAGFQKPSVTSSLMKILQEPECAAAELAKDAEVAAVYKKLMQHVGMADGEEGDEFTGLHDDADMGSDEDAMDDL